MEYAVYVEEHYEAWLEEFPTLKEARARVTHWRTRPKKVPGGANRIVLVRIMSEHEEGDLS